VKSPHNIKPYHIQKTLFLLIPGDHLRQPFPPGGPPVFPSRRRFFSCVQNTRKCAIKTFPSPRFLRTLPDFQLFFSSMEEHNLLFRLGRSLSITGNKTSPPSICCGRVFYEERPPDYLNLRTPSLMQGNFLFRSQLPFSQKPTQRSKNKKGKLSGFPFSSRPPSSIVRFAFLFLLGKRLSFRTVAVLTLGRKMPPFNHVRFFFHSID